MPRGWLIPLALFVILPAAPVSAGRIELLSKKGTTELPRAAGEVAEAFSTSADGRYVAFLSNSPNLVAGQIDGNNEPDLFLWDRDTGEIRLVTHRSGSPAATAGYGVAPVSYGAPQLSADGRWIAFCSRAVGLPPGQEKGDLPFSQVYLWDRETDGMTLVTRTLSTPARGAQGDSCSPAISADGRYLAFISNAGDLLFSTATGTSNVYLYDRDTATLTLASHAAPNPSQGSNGSASGVMLSADGRWAAYLSDASNLVAGLGSNSLPDVYLFDRATGSNALVSHTGASLLAEADGPSYGPRISADGGWIAFGSEAGDLVAGQNDTLGSMDVFLWERATGTTRLVSHASDSATTAGNGRSEWLSLPAGSPISADGASVTFQSQATDLIAGIVNGAGDVYLFDRTAGINLLISHAAGSPMEGAFLDSFAPSLASGGSHVFFSSRAPDLVFGGITPGASFDLYAWDRKADTAALLSPAAGSPAMGGNGGSQSSAPAGDGLSLAFRSAATDLTALPDTNRGFDLFQRDLVTGATTPLSFSPPLPTVTPFGRSENRARQAVSAEGRFVVFESSAADLVPGQSGLPGQKNVFLIDRKTRVMTLVSHSAASPTAGGQGDSTDAVLSRDGRYVAFLSSAVDLVAGQSGKGTNVFLFDRETGTSVLASYSPGDPTSGNCNCSAPWISDNGRYVAFGEIETAFLYDRDTGGLTPVRPDVPVTGIALSADGRFLAFLSELPDVAPGQVDVNVGNDVFLYDTQAGTTLLVSRNAAAPSTTGNGGADRVAGLSADGRFIAFISTATDHVTGQIDSNNRPDLFLFDRVTETISLVSHGPGSPPTVSASRGVSTAPGDVSLSRDGRITAFTSSSPDLVQGQEGSSVMKIYRYDHLSGGIAMVSHRVGVFGFVLPSANPVVSGDGSRIVFVGKDAMHVPGVTDANDREDVFLYDLSSGSLELMSHGLGAPAVAAIGAAGLLPSLSEDGRIAVFTSGAVDLVADDNNLEADVFAFVPEELDFYTLPSLPACRLFDSRLPGDGPALVSNLARVVETDSLCGIPATAKALAVNLTVIQPGGAGYLTLYPGDGLPPRTSTLTFAAGQIRTGNATVLLAPSGSGTLAIRPVVAGSESVDVVIDVAGYFK